MLVIACNTATAVALESLNKKMPFPVIGVIFPGARAAIKATKTHRNRSARHKWYDKKWCL